MPSGMDDVTHVVCEAKHVGNDAPSPSAPTAKPRRTLGEMGAAGRDHWQSVHTPPHVPHGCKNRMPGSNV